MSGFPQPFVSTVSHWQATNRGPGSLYGHGRDSALSSEVVDYVIIGAGLTGSSLAYQLSKQLPDKSICVLEAKDVASGASGRNGGHIAPYTPAAFSNFSASLEDGGAGLSAEEAIEVVYHEMDNFRYAVEVIHREGWAVDLWEGERVEMITTEEGVKNTKKSLEAFETAKKGSSRFKDYPVYHEFIEDPREVSKLSRMPSAKAVLKYPSGSVHPHKLATAFLKTALKSPRCNVYSWSPVSSIKLVDGVWQVDAGARGMMQAKEVVVCTNAHTGWLFEGSSIDQHLKPYRGSCAQITPTPSYSGPGGLKYTGSTEGACYHMTLPTGQLVVGVGNGALVAHGIITRAESYGVVDDSQVHPGTEKFLSEYCQSKLENWGEEAKGEGIMRVWSGIMCASRDTLPLVGAVPGKEGMWIAVGFHGHGMSRIPATTRGLANHIATGQWDPSLPKAFKISEDRMGQGRMYNKTRWAQFLGLDTLDDPGLAPAPTEDPKEAKSPVTNEVER